MRDAIGERLARLWTEAQEVLQAASVLGQEFSFDDLRSMIEIGERELEASLEEGIEAQLMREGPGDAYTFDHALTHQTLYSELSSRRKRRLHRAAAEALVSLPERPREKRVAEIARHYQEADDSERALPYTLLAADQAEAVFAHGEGERQYRLAVDLAADIGDAAVEGQALEKLGRVLQATARLREARESFEHAAQIYHALGDLEGERRVTVHLARMLYDLGDEQEAINRTQPLLSGLQRDDPTQALAELHLVLASALTRLGRFEEALDAAARAGEIARGLGDEAITAAAEGRRGFALLAKGDTDAAIPVLEHTIALAASSGDLDTLCRAVLNLAGMEPGESTSLAHIRLALDLTEQENDPVRLASLIDILIDWGRTEEAKARLERALAHGQEAGMSASALYPLLWLRGLIAMTVGDWEASRRSFEETVRLAEQGGYVDSGVRALVHLAWQDLWEGRPDQALARLEPERDNLIEWGMAPSAVMAEAYLQRGDLEQAERVLTESLERHADEALAGRSLVLRVGGMVHARQGRWEEASRWFEDAVAQARSVGMVRFEAHVLYDHGLMYQEQGEPELARERLQAALALFRQMGARPFIERSEQHLNAVP